MLDSLGCIEPGCADGLQIIGGISSTNPVYTPTGSLRLTPNPAREYLHIFIDDFASEKGPYNIEAWSISSQKMADQKVPTYAQDVQISTALWPQGMYILILGDKHGLPIAMEKLVVE